MMMILIIIILIKKIPFNKIKKLNKKNKNEDDNNLFYTTLKNNKNSLNNFSNQNENSSENFSSIQNGAIENKKKKKRNLSNFNINRLNNFNNNNNNFNNDKINFNNFLKSHKLIIINENEYNNNKLLIKLNQLKNNFEFFSDLKKITFSGNKNNIKKYINRFCAIKNYEFQCYNSKDKFILNNSLTKINIKDIKKVNLCEFKTDNNKSINNNNKIILYHFILFANEDTFEVYASEKEELINKWVYILNFFINNNL